MCIDNCPDMGNQVLWRISLALLQKRRERDLPCKYSVAVGRIFWDLEIEYLWRYRSGWQIIAVPCRVSRAPTDPALDHLKIVAAVEGQGHLAASATMGSDVVAFSEAVRH
jgi:hypothetical protein